MQDSTVKTPSMLRRGLEFSDYDTSNMRTYRYVLVTGKHFHLRRDPIHLRGFRSPGDSA